MSHWNEIFGHVDSLTYHEKWFYLKFLFNFAEYNEWNRANLIRIVPTEVTWRKHWAEFNIEWVGRTVPMHLNFCMFETLIWKLEMI